MVYAFVEPRPNAEAIIVFDDVSWPITSEAKAYSLAKKVGVPGFWRMKDGRGRVHL